MGILGVSGIEERSWGTGTLQDEKRRSGFVTAQQFLYLLTRIAQPGTYDALSHLFFTPLPTAGSSGGPIIDEESGAVIGVMLGTRMDNRVEGVRGWGVPAEAIYEVHCTLYEHSPHEADFSFQDV